ncbi:glycerol-3-phosphate cytidylyltransferase [Legionella sp. W05-934-2]|jgi:glycerol-3-phosphate cytidylyltransferase|uniref:glycerol-3-phosphate cytidylyltransferase n=1 Tax=Legionella sp. W05-934-2 TaxID=1198649 RepID=UPI0034619A90
MKTIITYGTFDLTHAGHISMLARAKSYGDRLIVGLSTDEFNLVKNKHSVFSYQHRRIILEAIRYVDMVIPEHSWSQKEKDIQDYNVDIFIMGNDWEGQFDNLKKLCQVIYLERTEGISTTFLKNMFKSMHHGD